MNIKGEVQHGGSGRQDPQLTRWREHEYLLGRRLRKLVRTAFVRMLKGVTHGCQPFVQLRLVLDALVGPV